MLQVYTREYVSPEVAQAVVSGAVSITADPSWDLWGIGIIMWDLATGAEMRLYHLLQIEILLHVIWGLAKVRHAMNS